MAIDITRGFDVTSSDLVVTELRANGLLYGTSVTAGVQPGVDTSSVHLTLGLLQGGVLSALFFAFGTAPLLARLRASGLGALLGATWAGAFMLMDDLVLLARSPGELRSMLAVVFQWAHEARYALALEDKSHVLAPDDASVGAAFPAAYLPPGGGPQAAVSTSFRLESALTYLGFRLGPGGRPCHAPRQLGIANGVVARMVAQYSGRTVVTFRQALQLWTLHGRVHLEWPAAVLPPDDPGILAYDDVQARALAALLGPAAVNGHAGVLELWRVFGLWRVDERRVLARARYAFVLAQSRRRPQRRALVDELRRRAATGVEFRAPSVTGAVDAALAELGLDFPSL